MSVYFYMRINSDDDWDEKKWELNDIAYKVSPDLNQDMIGYIIEYEP